MNSEELALIFYNNMLENGDDSYDPDSQFTRILNEIEEVMTEHLDFKTLSKLEGLILSLSSEDVEKHYIWGFCTALEVAKVVYTAGEEISLECCKHSKDSV